MASFFSSDSISEFLTKLSLFVAVLQTQRRVTFHLPDGSQESCSDSGLGDPEPSSTASTSQPLPLSFPQEEYYEQTSPNSRTEGDGNSDPESSEFRFEFLILFRQQANVIICILGGDLVDFVADFPEYRKGGGHLWVLSDSRSH